MKTTKDRFLPNIFKPIGFWIAGGVAVVATTLRILDVTGGPVWGNIGQSAVIIGLLVAAMSRDRAEDEMLLQVRLRSVVHAFCAVALYVALRPLFDTIRGGAAVTAWSAMLYMLCIYHTNFIITKRRMRHENKE